MIRRSSAKAELDQDSWDRFLERLTADPSLAGADASEKYTRLHQKLEVFFEARHLRAADRAADETLDRVAKHISDGRQISNLGGYVWSVARFIYREYRKREQPIVEGELPIEPPLVPSPGESDKMLVCCEACLKHLSADHQTLIKEFFAGDGRAKIEARKALAMKMGINSNALYIRVSRIKDKLEACILDCLAKGD